MSVDCCPLTNKKKIMQLKNGTLLKHGEYRIEKVLGQGGFGITYLAEQVKLHRKVAIKEFFMKEYCNRDTDTSQVSVPSVGSKELVEKFREKFVKEAQNIASFNHNNIIRIYDVFEENNTAYYVMEYLDCGSLSEYVSKRGRLSEKEAMVFIRQIADALSYIHEQKVNHLDVKPGNILLDKKNNAVLIDFGLSKHYDSSGSQTSSTPVGISKGYAPWEQYKQGGVSKFSPETDIYSLGATFYKLVTGDTPPEAGDVNENGLSFPSNVKLSDVVKKAIISAMQPKRKDRPQSISEFLNILDAETEETEVEVVDVDYKVPKTPGKRNKRTPILILILSIILCVGGYFVYTNIQEKKAEEARIEVEAVYEQMQGDKSTYIGLISEGDKLLKNRKYSESISKYEQAKTYEDKYSNTEYSVEFDKDASQKIASVNKAEQKYKAEQTRLEKERQEKERKEREAAAKAEHESKRLAEAQRQAAYEQMQGDKSTYLSLINEGDTLLNDRKYSESISKYVQAKTYEDMYSDTEYSGEFNMEVFQKIASANKAEQEYNAEQARLEKERQEREAAAKAEQARLEKERQKREAAAKAEQAKYKGHEYVDLGLSVKWATCNVGASSPEDYGDYFAWGETKTKSTFKESNSVTYGKQMSDIKGNSQYDAARANWGGSWRLPTKKEMEELKNKCTWTWTTQSGVKGYKVTGPNGNSIFLPAAGYSRGSSLNRAGEYGLYWSSTPNENDTNRAYNLFFYSSNQNVSWYGRDNGLSVRPVAE